jgi:hypothetical protein
VPWVEQRLKQGRCEATGLSFDSRGGEFGVKRPFVASIDRVDNKKGYTQDNCRVVVWIFNLAKATWTDAEVLKMAEAFICRL